MPANPLTPNQLSEAALLKSIFKEWQNRQREIGNKVSQEKASELLGFGQSALSQYLNGKIPLNIDAAIKIATLVGRTVSDFSPTLAKQAAKYANTAAVVAAPVAPNQVPPPAMLRKAKWDGIPDGPALDAALRDLEKRASPRSQAIIANLIELANKNALTDDDWEAIQWIAQRISH